MKRDFDFADQSLVDSIRQLKDNGATYVDVLRHLLAHDPQATDFKLGCYLDSAFGIRPSGLNAINAWKKGKIPDERLEILISCKITNTLERQRAREFVTLITDIMGRLGDRLPKRSVKIITGLLQHQEWSRAFPFLCEQVGRSKTPIDGCTYREMASLGERMGFSQDLWQSLEKLVMSNDRE